MSNSVEHATRILNRLSDGDVAAAGELAPLVYDKLRAVAAAYLKADRPHHTLQPTAVVHEAYVRLADDKAVDWRGKAHFFAVAAKAMRAILVDHARRHNAQKRGGGWKRVTLEALVSDEERTDLDLLTLDDAMRQLAEFDERQAKIVGLRFFAGMSVREIAELCDVHRNTVTRDLQLAQALLLRRIDREGPS